MILNSLGPFAAENFDYVLLPGRSSPSAPMLHDQAQAYFESYWKRLLAENGVHEEVPVIDSFSQADIVSLVTYKGAIAGMTTHSFLDMNQTEHREHSYFQGALGSTFLERLDARETKRVMTFEWLTINPELRKRHIGFSLAMVNLALASRIQRASGAEASLQRAREDVGVDRMVQAIGGEIIQRQVPVHNTPVAVMMTWTGAIRDVSEPVVQHYVEHLWERRTDHTGFTASDPGAETASPALTTTAA